MSTLIKIKGMSCNHCAMAVTKALKALSGIAEVQVDLAAGTAAYTEIAPVDSALVKAAITKAGYEVLD